MIEEILTLTTLLASRVKSINITKKGIRITFM